MLLLSGVALQLLSHVSALNPKIVREDQPQDSHEEFSLHQHVITMRGREHRAMPAPASADLSRSIAASTQEDEVDAASLAEVSAGMGGCTAKFCVTLS